MPRFFDKKNLTEIEKTNWDSAMQKYLQIQNVNKGTFKQDNEIDLLSFNNPGDEKSALFFRLLNGKKALKYPPPCSYSYPWYGIIEENKSYEIMFDDELTISKWKEKTHVNIDQTSWKIIEVISENELLITYGEWESLGYVWQFKNEITSCEETSSFICSWHNPEIKRITTLTQLKLEQKWHVENRFSHINLVLDNDYKEKHKQTTIEKYGTGYGSGVFLNELENGIKMLEARKQKGLTDYPTEKEIEIETEINVQDYLNRGIIVGEFDKLYTRVWKLKKLLPLENNVNIYID